MTEMMDLPQRVKPPARHRVRLAFSLARLRIRLGTYSTVQLAHARVIRDVVKARGLPERALVIALETAMTESNIKVYANRYNAESLRLPHDAIGSDHASVGIFQQQVPMWGTTHDCMDPAHSCTKFLNRLVQHNWQSMSNWQAAQAVQVSAYSDGSNYRRNNAAAASLAAQLWAEHPPTPPTPARRKDRDMLVYRVVNPPAGAHNVYLLRSAGPPVPLTGSEAVATCAALGQPLAAGNLANLPPYDQATHVALGGQ